ncbi:hypothetical protein ACFL6Y_05280 [Elusimicrobiota bacterium]
MRTDILDLVLMGFYVQKVMSQYFRDNPSNTAEALMDDEGAYLPRVRHS